MTKKEKFIKIIQTEIFDRADIWAENYEADWEEIVSFWNDFKNENKNSTGMTENGAKILNWMQENNEQMMNVFTSKEIAEALFTSGRSVAGSMRKLINDGYVEKSIGKTPIQYMLTESGKSYKI